MNIYKYDVSVSDKFTIDMPINAEILSFQDQGGLLRLWAAVWPNSSTESRKFAVRGTGHEIDMDTVKKFIGTAQQLNGKLVWHLFELK